MSVFRVTPESELEAELALDVQLEVPHWVLRGMFKTGGIRLKKFVEYHDVRDPRCGVCLMDTDPRDRAVVQGLVYHMECYKRRLMAKETYNYVDTSGVTPRGIPIVPRDAEQMGNLGEAEYHLWVGSRMPDANFAKCRCCKAVTLNSNERQLHKLDTRYFVGKMPCYQVLGQAYKALAVKHKCVCCRKPAIDMRYGVNLCDWRCANAWKFELGDHLDLAIAVANIRCEELERERLASRQSYEKDQFN